jgi:DNA-binding Lrp family transcriptional regulator
LQEWTTRGASPSMGDPARVPVDGRPGRDRMLEKATNPRFAMSRPQTMDLADLRLLAILNGNSRTPFRELAEKLGISVQAVHKRVQTLTETHVIARFTANLSIKYLKAVPVGVYGISTAKDMNAALKELGNDDSTVIVHGSGDFVSIMVLLRSIADLEHYVEFAKKTLSMEAPVVALPAAMGYTILERTVTTEPPFELAPLDYRIILSLHGNSRKEIAEIAQELGISAATVKRRLTRLIDEKAVEFSTEFHPGDENGFSTMTFLQLRSGIDKGPFFSELKQKYGPRIIFMSTSSNDPNAVSVFMWSASMKDSRDMEASFKTNPIVQSCNHYMIQYKHQFPTWRKKMLEEKAAEAIK